MYVYSNLMGAGGNRMYYPSVSTIFSMGNCYAYGDAFSLGEMDVVMGTVNLVQVRKARRTQTSFAYSGNRTRLNFQEIPADIRVCRIGLETSPIIPIQNIILPKIHSILLASAAYLWNFLKRTKSSGYFLALSGGKDSASVASMIYFMC